MTNSQFECKIKLKGYIYPLDISFQSVSSFLNNYKKAIKKKVKTLPRQKNPTLNGTDINEVDDPVNKRIKQQTIINSQTTNSQTAIFLIKFFTKCFLILVFLKIL